jgi:fructokinase
VSVAVVGEALIDFIADEDGAYRPHLGGSPYNVAIGLARQGIAVSYLSPLSEDSFGDQLRDSLQAENVALPITRRSLRPTSLALVAIDNDGLPTYQLYREGVADKDTSFEEIEANLPDDLQLLHTGSLAITPSQLPRTRRLFDLMHERGGIVSVDINIRLRASFDTKAYLDGIRSLLSEADIVKASDEDLDALQLDPDARRGARIAFAEMGSGVLILTEGRGGALLHTAKSEIEKFAYPVSTVEDTVGAGDTFHSAFLASLLRSGSMHTTLAEIDQATLGDAVDFGCASAAINISRVGCSPPTQSEVENFIKSSRIIYD